MSISFIVRELTLQEVRRLYRERLCHDFPENERKPLFAIESALLRHEYACYGAVSGEEILAYAFLVWLKMDDQPVCLFDYLAVRGDLRGKGIGGAFLNQLTDGPLKPFSCVLLEVDDPTMTDDAQEKAIREKRLDFYLRNGLRDTGARANVFGADFLILEFPTSAYHTTDLALHFYGRMLRRVMPASIYRRMVRLDTYRFSLAVPKTPPSGT